MKRNNALSTAMSCCTWILVSAFGAIVGIGLNLIPLVGSLDAAAQVLPTQQVGRQQDGTVVTTTNQVLTPAGRQVEFEGRPNAVALSPDGTTAALLNAGDKAIILIEVQTGAVKQEFDAAGASASSSGIVYAKGGKTIYASDGDGNLITANVEANGTLALAQKIKLPPGGISSPGAGLNPYPTGLTYAHFGDLTPA